MINPVRPVVKNCEREANTRVSGGVTDEGNESRFWPGVRRSLPLLGLVLLTLVGWLLSEFSVDAHTRAKNADLQRESARLGVKIVNLKARRDSLRSEIERLRTDPEETNYHARNQLGMVKAGEVVYQFVDSSEARAPSRSGSAR